MNPHTGNSFLQQIIIIGISLPLSLTKYTQTNFLVSYVPSDFIRWMWIAPCL